MKNGTRSTVLRLNQKILVHSGAKFVQPLFQPVKVSGTTEGIGTRKKRSNKPNTTKEHTNACSAEKVMRIQRLGENTNKGA